MKRLYRLPLMHLHGENQSFRSGSFHSFPACKGFSLVVSFPEYAMIKFNL